MNLYAPNVWLFIATAILAILGITEYLSIAPQIPGLSPAKDTWLIFLAWFLLAVGSVLPTKR